MRSKTLISGHFYAIVFDCGDTLVRLNPAREKIFQEAAAEAGIRIGLADIRRAYEVVEQRLPARSSQLRTERSREAFYLKWNTALCSSLGISKAATCLHRRLREEFEVRRHWVAFPDAKASLKILSRLAPLYVLANWDLRLPDVLGNSGLRGYFRSIHASAELGVEKPEQACFEKFLRRTRLRAATTLYVGNDYVADVVGARRAGLTPILVDRMNRLTAADCVRVRSLLELAPLLATHLG